MVQFGSYVRRVLFFLVQMAPLWGFDRLTEDSWDRQKREPDRSAIYSTEEEPTYIYVCNSSSLMSLSIDVSWLFFHRNFLTESDAPILCYVCVQSDNGSDCNIMEHRNQNISKQSSYTYLLKNGFLTVGGWKNCAFSRVLHLEVVCTK